MENLLADIKVLIVNTLELEDIEPGSIGDDEMLFDEGLGLDSIDALELGIALEKNYGIDISEDDETLPEHFQSARTLARFVETNRA
jgi:acyl carrier protein